MQINKISLVLYNFRSLVSDRLVRDRHALYDWLPKLAQPSQLTL